MQLRGDKEGGLPGQVSNRDLIFLKQAVPGLNKTYEGNLKILDLSIKLNERKIQRARMANEYAREHGQIDAGFDQQMIEYAEANPLFEEEADTWATDMNRRGAELEREHPDWSTEQIDEQLKREGL